MRELYGREGDYNGQWIRHGTKVDLTELWQTKIDKEQDRIAATGMVSIDPILRSNPRN